MKIPIHFIVLDDGIEYPITTHDRQYRNLMCLLNDKLFLDSFGECGGVGRCSTCLVKITRLTGNSVILERNEPITQLKMEYTDENCRLACQLMVNKDLNNIVLEFITLGESQIL